MGNKTLRERLQQHREDERRLLFESYQKSKQLGKQIGELLKRARKNAEDGSRIKLFEAVPHLEGDRVVLDRVVDSDASALLDLINNPRVQRYIPTYLFERQCDDVHATIQMLYGDLFESEESLILAVRAKDTGELAGLAEFYGLRDELHKVSVG